MNAWPESTVTFSYSHPSSYYFNFLVPNRSSPFDDATLIMRFKTRARDYMATAERNAYQQRQLVDQLLPGRARQSDWKWEVARGRRDGCCLPGDVLSSRGMTFCVCHDECACRQQWLLFIHAHTHTQYKRSNELCVVEKFSMNLLYFFTVVILFCFVCNMLSLLPAAFINNYFVVLATSRVFSLSATARPPGGRRL